MNDVIYWSATRLAREIKNNSISAAEAVDACLSRIAQVNPEINAAVQIVEERARKEAVELDNMLSRGKCKGPLHGVPISLKDSIDTEGVISTGGTKGRENHIPEKDAPVAARLRDAGAILIAKTNTPELTLSGETCNLIYGRSSNPYDLARSPGGSSGGSAAIIAAGGSFLEMGSDTGGSIREPAHLCGITGIKPTFGRVPRTGHIYPWGMGVLDSLTQVGPMARYVEDLALSLPIICGQDGVDPSLVPVPVPQPMEIDLQGLRIALYTNNGVIEPGADISRVVTEVGDKLSDQGCRVDNVIPEVIARTAELYCELRKSVGAESTRRLLDRYGTKEPGPYMKYIFDSNGPTSNQVDNRLIENIDRTKCEFLAFMREYDAIICPASHTIARPHDASLEDAILTWSHITVHNLLGVPGAVVRAGTSDTGNLPVGVQIVTSHWREDLALAIAAKIENLFGGYQKPDL